MPKVLLVEDDLTMVSLLMTLLKMEGFDVVALDVDADVPAVVRSERPDVLFLDVHLSNQSGLDVISNLRKNKQTRHVRVVMTSGLDMREECLKHGADGFLLKPFMPDDLIKVLKQYISK